MDKLTSASASASKAELARVIDHSLLKPTATEADIDNLCSEALRYGFWSVCVNPVRVRQAARRLKGSTVRVCSVVGFPFGSSTTEVKLAEARRAIEDGALELDMVSSIGALKAGNDRQFYKDVKDVASLCRRSKVLLKVILECCYLSDREKVRGARLAERAGADFVKTSTGFGAGGATLADVKLLRKALSRRTGIKAAGGIRTLDQALGMLRAGADRIGTSSGAKMIEEASHRTA